MNVEFTNTSEVNDSNDIDNEFESVLIKTAHDDKSVRRVKNTSLIYKDKKRKIKDKNTNDELFSSILAGSNLLFGPAVVSSKSDAAITGINGFSIQRTIDRERLKQCNKNLSNDMIIQCEGPNKRNDVSIEKNNLLTSVSYQVGGISKIYNYGEVAISTGFSVINDSLKFSLRNGYDLLFLAAINHNVNDGLLSNMLFNENLRSISYSNQNDSFFDTRYRNSNTRNYRVFFKGLRYLFEISGDRIVFNEEGGDDCS